MLKIKKYRKWLLIFLLLLIFLWLTVVVTTHETLWIDEIVYNKIISLYSPNVTRFFIWYTSLWSTYMIIFMALLTTVLFYRKNRIKIYSLIPFFTPMIIYIINRVIKNIVQRPRPNILRLVSETSYSFPSWHTMESLAVYWVLIMFIWLTIKNKAIKYVLIWLLSLIIILIMVSRIYLWVHYFTDIIWGIILSSCYLIYISIFLKKF